MPRAILNSYQIEGSFTFFFYYKIKKTLSLEDLIVYNGDIVMKRGKKMKKKKLLALSSIMMIGIGMASCVGEQETMATSQIPSTTTTTTPTTVAPTTKVPTTTAIPSTSQDPLAGKSEGYKKVYNMTDKQKEILEHYMHTPNNWFVFFKLRLYREFSLKQILIMMIYRIA